MIDPILFKPYVNSTIAVCPAAFILTFFYLFSKWQIFCRYIHSFYIIIVATSWYFEKPAHFAYWIFIFMTVDNHKLYTCSHFLSVSERKSRNNSFSIFSRLFSYLYSCNVFAGFLPRCFGNTLFFDIVPIQHCIAYLLMPYFLLNSHCDNPSLYSATIFSLIPCGYFFMPFIPDITKPPMVVSILP